MRISCMECEWEYANKTRSFDDINECAFRVILPDLPPAFVCGEHVHAGQFAQPLPTRLLTA